MKKALSRWTKTQALLFVLIAGSQTVSGLVGVSDAFTRGHNGFNNSAYHNAARNTLRWGTMFPVQYSTRNSPPEASDVYTHHPLAMHWHNVASMWVFGDRELAVRLVAALHGVLAVAMLMLVAGALWSPAHGLLSGFTYLVLPTNLIYANMANHSSGFIAWGLLALWLFVRTKRWSAPSYGAFLFSFFMCAMWDWPAYYLAACIALYWIGGKRHTLRRSRAERLLFFGFCAWVLILFLGHFVLVDLVVGGVGELVETYNVRRNVGWPRLSRHLRVVPPLMFTWPVLMLSLGWIVAWIVRLLRGRSGPRDLIPVAFAFAGVLHYVLFRWSAMVHSYWAWTALPFVAIAVSTSVFASAQATPSPGGIARASRLAGLALACLVFGSLLKRDVEIVPTGRYVGGSMWFFTPVRGATDTYDSGRPELRFAERVKAWTDRDTGVQLHPSLKSRRLEPRFDITLDRATYRWSPRPRPHITNDQGVEGWVFIAPVQELPENERIDLAARYPYRQFDGYFMVDLRTEGTDIEIWDVAPQATTPSWWLFQSAFEPPVIASRSPTKEASLRNKVGQHHVE